MLDTVKNPTIHTGTWLCLECHKELETMMNIGYAKRGMCERCNSIKHFIYMVEG
jgi:hypothetical protein